MGKSIQDLINTREIKNLKVDEFECNSRELTSLKGIERFKNLRILRCAENNITSLEPLQNLKNLKRLFCYRNKLDSLEGIQNLEKLEDLYVFENKLSSLKGLENLINLKELNISRNPCTSKYEGLSVKQIQEKIKIELHLKPDDDRRGEASMMDTGLFDFKGL